MFIPNQNIKIVRNLNTITAISLQNESTPGILTRMNVKPNTEYTIHYKGYSNKAVILWIADQHKKMIHIAHDHCLDNRKHTRIYRNTAHTIIYIGFLFRKGSILHESFTIHYFRVSENIPILKHQSHATTSENNPKSISEDDLKPTSENNPKPTSEDLPHILDKNKVGIVITTHGRNGILVRQCIYAFIDFIKKYPIYIVLHINESDDPITLKLQELFPNIDVIYVHNQDNNGGLTGTWNQGIDRCIQHNCKVVILSNDDILIDNSIHHIVDDAMNCKKKIYFGPCSNCPCTKNLMRIYNDGICLSSSNKRPRILYKDNRPFELNGFFMCFPTHVLIKNKFNAKYYFNPAFPFAGNETEWFRRFNQKRGIGLLVYRTFVYHFKRASWHKKDLQSDQICIYTVITSPFDHHTLFHANTVSNCDCLCFSNKIQVLQHAIQMGWKPMYLPIENDVTNYKNKIKMMPNEYLPHCYTHSIYLEQYSKTPFLNADEYIKNCNMEKLYCIKNKTPSKMNEELSNLLITHAFPISNEIYDTSLLVRKHKELLKFGKEWFSMYSRYKDNIVFDYLIWKYNININSKKYKQNH